MTTMKFKLGEIAKVEIEVNIAGKKTTQQIKRPKPEMKVVKNETETANKSAN